MNEDYTIKEFSDTKELVLKLLEKSERCRNDDKFLTYRVFEEIAKRHGEKIYIPFKLWSVFPAFETVKRVRAEIQNKRGLFKPTDAKVIEKRKSREKTIKKQFSPFDYQA